MRGEERRGEERRGEDGIYTDSWVPGSVLSDVHLQRRGNMEYTGRERERERERDGENERN